MPEAAIELGEVAPSGDGDEPGAGGRQPAWFRYGLPVLLLAVVALFIPGGSVGSRGDTLSEPLWARHVSWDGLAFGSRQVFVPDGRDGATVVALDAATGTEIWRREVTGRGPVRLRELDEGAVAILREGSMLVNAADTGEPLHVAPMGFPWAVTGTGHVVIVESEPQGTTDCPRDPSSPGVSCDVLLAVPAAGGAPAWRVTLPRARLANSTVDGRLRGFVSITEAGQADWYDAETGAKTATTAIAPGTMIAIVVDDRLVALTAESDRRMLRSYTRAGVLEWQLPLPAESLSGAGSRLNLYHCDDFACLTVNDSTFIVDPRTGVAKLRLAHAGLTEIGAGRFLATFGPGAGRNLTVQLWDAASGTRVAELPDSIPIPWQDSAGRGLLAQRGSAGTSFILVQPTGDTRFLGTLPDDDLSCEAKADLLLCRGWGRIQVWRLPS